jgi:hypothetical protein
VARLTPASLLAGAALAACTAGCETLYPQACDTSAADNPSIVYTGGSVQNGVYFSSQEPQGGASTSPWSWELLSFPGGAHYSLAHGLGVTPDWALPYLSFDEYGNANGGAIGAAAGNEVEILEMDDLFIKVANANCAPFYLLVVAGTGASQPSPP